MDEQRVPNLQEMDDQQAQHFLTELLSNHHPEEEYNVRHPDDYVMEMPQSGERFRGRENMRSRSRKPTPPRHRLSRCAECWSRRDCGLSRGSSTTATGGYWTSWSSASCVMGRCGETGGTSQSRLRRRSGGRSGLRGWNPKAPQAYLTFSRIPYAGSPVSEKNPSRQLGK
jgi:hypothetical protein